MLSLARWASFISGQIGRRAGATSVYSPGMSTCRCGHSGTGPHPCHGKGYSCKKPATQRFYLPPKLGSLAGNQLKVSMVETWACDTCWQDWCQITQGSEVAR